ncbi:hypothetical protein ACFLV7_16615 [Chloroflexota bacterium]
MKESSLHASIKTYFTQDVNQQEVFVDGFLIDVVCKDLLVEIQTRSFYQLKAKLFTLLKNYKVRIVHPIAAEKWIIYLPADRDEPIRRRKSPKRGRYEHLFRELVYISRFVFDNNFSIEILLIHEEEIRRDDGLGSWRRKGWSIIDRRLIEVIDQVLLSSVNDYQMFLPENLPQPFTTKNLSLSLHIPHSLAQQMAYCLRSMNIITVSDKRGREILYTTRCE